RPAARRRCRAYSRAKRDAGALSRRQRDPKCCAFGAGADELEFAAHGAREFASDGKAQARTARFRRRGDKRLEQASAKILAHTWAVIDDIDLAAPLEPRSANDEHLVAAGVIFHRLRCVADQIAEDAVQMLRIGHAG